MKHEMHDLRQMLNDELIKLSQKGITASSLDMIDKLSHSIKSIDTIIAMEGSGYSEDDYSRTGNYGGNSYARSRDSQGRYSRGMRGGRYSYDEYSRDGGKEGIVEQLRDMLDDTSDSKLRMAIQKAINTIEE